jgi:hypothetical protein
MLRTVLRILALIPFLARLPQGAAATPSEWPMFRGDPALTGRTEAKVPSTPNLAWKFQTGGPVASSAAILGDRVFIGSADSNVVCLSLVDGRKLWSFRASGPIEA